MNTRRPLNFVNRGASSEYPFSLSVCPLLQATLAGSKSCSIFKGPKATGRVQRTRTWGKICGGKLPEPPRTRPSTRTIYALLLFVLLLLLTIIVGACMLYQVASSKQCGSKTEPSSVLICITTHVTTNTMLSLVDQLLFSYLRTTGSLYTTTVQRSC